MADSNFVLARGFDAEAAVTKNRAVKAGSAGGCTPVTAEGDKVLGVAMFSVSSAEILRGKGASLAMLGIAEMEAAGAIGLGDPVGIDGSGKAIASNSGARIVGECVGNPSTNDGDVISVLLSLPGVLAA